MDNQETLHIVCPEAVLVLQKRQLVAFKHPNIALSVPCISSEEEYVQAKCFMKFSLEYAELLQRIVATSVISSSQVVFHFQREMNFVASYHATLCHEWYKAYRTPTEDEDLKKTHYDILSLVAKDKILSLTKLFLQSGVRCPTVLQEIKMLEEELLESPEHHKQMKQLMTGTGLYAVLHPQTVRPIPKQQQKQSKKIMAYKTAKYNQMIVRDVIQHIPELMNGPLQNFDYEWSLKTREIASHFLELSTKVLSPDELQKRLEALIEEYEVLEKKAVQFRALLCQSSIPANILIDTEETTQLYLFLYERYRLSNQNPIGILECTIPMFIQAGKLELALIRVEALTSIIPTSIAQQHKFKAMRASVLALNGNFDEWNSLLAQTDESAMRKKVQRKQAMVQTIKKQQEQNETIKEKVVPRKTTPKLVETGPSWEFPEESPNCATTTTPTVLREKIKTRNPAKEFDCPLETEALSVPIQRDFPVSNAAFKTFMRIKSNFWKFPRKDLYNLFIKLGCKVDMGQGKGDHGSIHLFTMTLSDEEFIAVIPEFTSKVSLSNLTIPNWDEKWDGHVPPYMRKSIRCALEIIGATEATVHK